MVGQDRWKSPASEFFDFKARRTEASMKRDARLRAGVLILCAGLAAGAHAGTTPYEETAQPPNRSSVSLAEVTDGQTGGGDVTAGTVVYAKRDGTTLTSTASRTASEVETVNEGAPLTVQATERAYYQVKTESGKTGWVARFSVTEDEPKTSLGSVRILKSGNMGPQERSNVSAIRGLNPVAETYAEDKEVPPEAVEDAKKMEKFGSSVMNSDLDRFLKEGGIQP